MCASRTSQGFGPDDSITPEGLEELLEGPGIAADAELSVHSLIEGSLDPLEVSEPDSLVDEGLEFLTDEECHRLLNRAWIGRVGVSTAGVAVILPVRFAMVGDDVVFFTSHGLKLDAATAGKTMTFEVDSFDPRRGSGWSVLVVGTPELISRSDIYGRRAEMLHPAAPGQRDQLVRIRSDVVSGRRFGYGTRHTP